MPSWPCALASALAAPSLPDQNYRSKSHPSPLVCLDGTSGAAYAARGIAAVYEDQHSSARQGRPAQGQRCPGCGNVDPDPLARFCGVCGSTMSAGVAPVGTPTGPTAQVPAYGYDPPARRAPSAPPATMYASRPGQPGGGYAGQSVVYTIPSIGLVGASLFGAAIGAVFSLFPCLIVAWLVVGLVTAARRVLDALAGASFRVPIPVVPVDVPVNYVDLFRLRDLYDRIIFLDDRAWMATAILFAAPWLVLIVCGALGGLLLALVYNSVGAASGGMRVTLVPGQAFPTGQPVQPAGWSGGPPGPPTGQAAPWPQQGWPAEPRR